MKSENKIVTVTINPAIDQTVAVPNFTAGTVNRVQSIQMDAGGKGVNVSSNLADFGVASIATGFLGVENDEIFQRFFAHKGIEDRCVRIHGQTRTGVKIIDEVGQRTTDLNFPGQAPSPVDVERLFAILQELLATHEWFVLAGSIPAGVSTGIYYDMLQALSGAKVVLDTSGEGFLRALAGSPWLIKPNIDELQELVGHPLESVNSILEAARQISQQYGIACVVVSMGKEGAIFCEGEQAIWAVPPPVQVVSTVGAGDAMVAGIVAGKIKGFRLVDCARLATAFSVSAISKIGSGLPAVQVVQTRMEQVTIRKL
jgi:1-phosphofructokinase